MRSIDMPPDAPTLMWSTRAIGYTTSAAIADLIDNSISANASHINIEFMSGEEAYISILDDGTGMSSQELRLAMKYGSGTPWQVRNENDLGRFGLGLKTASLSQCKKLTVASKRGGLLSAYCWDLDHVIHVKRWELLELDQDDLAVNPQIQQLNRYQEGTIVIWNNLDKIFAGDDDKDKGLLKKIQEVEEHIAVTYHRFLQGEPGLKKICISSNGILIKPQDPFYIAKSDEMPSEQIPVRYTDFNGIERVDNVVVTPFILPFADLLTQDELESLGGKDGLVKNQGFYIYRNKRLIVAASWFRITRKTDLSKLCRVRVDIPNSLDEIWTIDVKKSMAIPPEIVLNSLRRIVAPIINAGRRKYKFRATKESSSDHIQVWLRRESRKGVIYSINPNYPIYKELIEDVKERSKLQIFVRLIEQTIPVNSIHTDFYEDKKYAFEDVDGSLENIIMNLKDLLKEVRIDQRQDEFMELMSMMPFSDYDIKYSDLGEIDNG